MGESTNDEASMDALMELPKEVCALDMEQRSNAAAKDAQIIP